MTAVFAYHAVPGDAPGGFIGVDIFFVLSGYLITSLLLREFENRGGISLRGFWTRRARRLFPAVWLLIAVCLVVSAVFIPDSLTATRRDALASLLYVQNWNLILGEPVLLRRDRPAAAAAAPVDAVDRGAVLSGLAAGAAGGAAAPAAARGLLAVCLTGALGSTTLMCGAVRARPGSLARLLRHRHPGGAAAAGRGAGDRVAGRPAAAWHRPRRPHHAGRARRRGAGDAAAGDRRPCTTTSPGLYRGGLAADRAGHRRADRRDGAPGRPPGTAWPTAQPLRWLGARSYGIYLWHWPVIVLTRPHLDVPIEGWPLVALQATVTLAAGRLPRTASSSSRSAATASAAMRERLPLQRPGGLAATGFATLAAIVLLAWAAALAGPRASLAAHLHATRAAQQAPTKIDAGPARRPPAAPTASTRRPARPVRTPPAAAISPAEPPPPATLIVGRGRRRRRPDDYSIQRRRAGDRRLGDAGRSRGSCRHTSGPARARGRRRRPPDRRCRSTALDAYRQAGALPQHVVIQVGDNGPVWYADLVRLRSRCCAGVPDVVFVSVRVPRSWQDEANTAVAPVRAPLAAGPRRRLVLGQRHARPALGRRASQSAGARDLRTGGRAGASLAAVAADPGGQIAGRLCRRGANGGRGNRRAACGDVRCRRRGRRHRARRSPARRWRPPASASTMRGCNCGSARILATARAAAGARAVAGRHRRLGVSRHPWRGWRRRRRPPPSPPTAPRRSATRRIWIEAAPSRPPTAGCRTSPRGRPAHAHRRPACTVTAGSLSPQGVDEPAVDHSPRACSAPGSQRYRTLPVRVIAAPSSERATPKIAILTSPPHRPAGCTA